MAKKTKLTKNEQLVIKCAYADLVGALEARNMVDMEEHDWTGHVKSIKELEETFSFIDPVPRDLLDCNEDDD